MKDYLPESMRRCPPGYARGELERAMEEGTILTARAVRCDETVSYTHLDVYKRQRVFYADVMANHFKVLIAISRKVW